MESISYSYRPFPKTTHVTAEAILKVMKRKKVVSLKDMQKATGKKWVLGALQMIKLTRTVESVRKGRKLLGFTLKTGKGTIKEKIPTARFKIVGNPKNPTMVALNDNRGTAPAPIAKKTRKRVKKTPAPEMVQSEPQDSSVSSEA